MPIQFVYPFFLWFLAALSIPIIIHLFNFRRFKKIEFTNVRFLKEIKEQTQSHSKLKHLLVLLMRLMALAFLILAFAQPFVPTKSTESSGQQIVSLYIDNSFSMNLSGKEGSLLDEAKDKCRTIATSLPSSTKFQLLTNEFKGEQQRLIDRDELLELTDHIKINPQSRNINEVLIRQTDALKKSNSDNRSSFIISDFQKSFFDMQPGVNDSLLKLNLLKTDAEEVKNIAIDSCWLSAPVIQLNTPSELNVKVRNYGNEDAEVPVRFYINNSQKTVASAKINAGMDATVKMNFTIIQPGWQLAKVEIDDNPIAFDDTYYLSFRIADKIPVYHIGSSKNIFIDKLLANNSLIDYTFSTQNAVDYAMLKKCNAVILTDLKDISSGMSDEIARFVDLGGTLIIFPDSNITPNGYENLFGKLNVENYSTLNTNSISVSKLDLANPLFHDMFEKTDERMSLPTVNQSYETVSSLRSGKNIVMQLQGGHSFLNYYHRKSGSVYQFTSAAQPAAGTFVTHALFAPVLFKTILLSAPSSQPTLFIGENSDIKIPSSIQTNDVLHLINSDTKTDIIPEFKTTNDGTLINLTGIEQAGFYQLKNLNDSILSIIALNYNRKESDLKAFSDEELKSMYGNGKFKSVEVVNPTGSGLTKFIKQYSSGISLWKYCILATLLFLIAETLLLRSDRKMVTLKN
ncbi:MAG TPA: BatA domain-containing protein [Bacteroidia bacterium]|nr:BatA domain-containing protein [Bacteroidia bacterium]HRF14281.1 BatA domain-containing protein [Bacteroidia bacterium]